MTARPGPFQGPRLVRSYNRSVIVESRYALSRTRIISHLMVGAESSDGSRASIFNSYRECAGELTNDRRVRVPPD